MGTICPIRGFGATPVLILACITCACACGNARTPERQDTAPATIASEGRAADPEAAHDSPASLHEPGTDTETTRHSDTPTAAAVSEPPEEGVEEAAADDPLPIVEPSAIAQCDTPPSTPACVVVHFDPEFASSTRGQAEMPALPALRARARQELIQALDSLGHDSRATAHVAQFVADYPRDRRSNGYRMRLAAARKGP